MKLILEAKARELSRWEGATAKMATSGDGLAIPAGVTITGGDPKWRRVYVLVEATTDGRRTRRVGPPSNGQVKLTGPALVHMVQVFDH